MYKFLTLICVLISVNIYSQVEYPIYYKDSIGDSYYVFKEEQVNIINKKLSILSYYEDMDIYYNSYDNTCSDIINKQNKIIIKLKEVSISKDTIIDNKNKQINKLEKGLDVLLKDNSLCDEQITSYKNIIVEKDKIIKKQKISIWLTGITGTILIIASLIIF